MIDTIKGAQVSAVVYSIVETAKANSLKPYEYLKYLLTEMPKHMDDTDFSFLDDLLPWSPAVFRVFWRLSHFSIHFLLGGWLLNAYGIRCDRQAQMRKLPQNCIDSMAIYESSMLIISLPAGSFNPAFYLTVTTEVADFSHLGLLFFRAFSLQPRSYLCDAINRRSLSCG